MICSRTDRDNFPIGLSKCFDPQKAHKVDVDEKQLQELMLGRESRLARLRLPFMSNSDAVGD